MDVPISLFFQRLPRIEPEMPPDFTAAGDHKKGLGRFDEKK